MEQSFSRMKKVLAVLLEVLFVASLTGVAVSAHGGNDRSGIDCSHLVYQVYKQVRAKSIVFQTVPNMKRNLNYVNVSSPSPGDVIFWEKDVIKNDKKYWLSDHVGICIGNGQFIHTSYDTKKVTIDNITGLYQDGIPYFAKWSHIQENFDLPYIFSSQKSGLNFSQ